MRGCLIVSVHRNSAIMDAVGRRELADTWLSGRDLDSVHCSQQTSVIPRLAKINCKLKMSSLSSYIYPSHCQVYKTYQVVTIVL